MASYNLILSTPPQIKEDQEKATQYWKATPEEKLKNFPPLLTAKINYKFSNSNTNNFPEVTEIDIKRKTDEKDIAPQPPLPGEKTFKQRFKDFFQRFFSTSKEPKPPKP